MTVVNCIGCGKGMCTKCDGEMIVECSECGESVCEDCVRRGMCPGCYFDEYGADDVPEPSDDDGGDEDITPVSVEDVISRSDEPEPESGPDSDSDAHTFTPAPRARRRTISATTTATGYWETR